MLWLSHFSNCDIHFFNYVCNIRFDGINSDSSQNGYEFCFVTFFRPFLLAECHTYLMSHFFLTRSEHVLWLESVLRILEEEHIKIRAFLLYYKHFNPLLMFSLFHPICVWSPHCSWINPHFPQMLINGVFRPPIWSDRNFCLECPHLLFGVPPPPV